MSNPATRTAAALPHLQPMDEATRLMLFAIRRAGAFGLHDANLAHAFLKAFGKNFRRPLVLLRTFMAECARTSKRPIRIAPGCCCRMTADERVMLDIVSHATSQPERAGLLLSDLLGQRDVDGVFATACLLNLSFEEASRPLRSLT